MRPHTKKGARPLLNTRGRFPKKRGGAARKRNGKIKTTSAARGNIFLLGVLHSCFYMVKRWVEKKVRQHLMRARGRKGFGWKRWSSEWLYERLGLFKDYRLVRWSVAKAAPARYAT